MHICSMLDRRNSHCLPDTYDLVLTFTIEIFHPQSLSPTFKGSRDVGFRGLGV